MLLATRSRELQTPKDAHLRWLFLCPKQRVSVKIRVLKGHNIHSYQPLL